MKYRDLIGTDLSWLGMGNMRFPTLNGRYGGPIDREKAGKLLDLAMAQGINYYDTAYVYHEGESEKFLGDYMKKWPRESYYLATKFFVFAGIAPEKMFCEQLERLQTDYVDFYLAHGVNDGIIDAYIDSGVVEWMEEKKKAGSIRHKGFSSHASPAQLERFLDLADWEFVQIQLNYYDWIYGTTKQEYELLKSRGIPVTVMEPTRGGKLCDLTPEANAILKEAHPDWSIASWAFRWLKRLDGVNVVLSGMSTPDQMEDNIATFSDDRALTDEEEQLLFRAAEMFHDHLTVPCTGCRYCCDDCPKQIQIPSIMDFYNEFKISGGQNLGFLHDDAPEARFTECVGCGSCQRHCPQNIDGAAVMSELAEAWEKMKAER